jgi:acyl dehydratase
MRNDNNSDSTKKNLVAYFTKRDLIIYALGIGCCSSGEYNEQDELRYVYERHPSFEMFPTFLLSLNFTAESESKIPKGQIMMGIRPFPPESMRISEHEPGIIPKAFLNTTVGEEMESLPILHMNQSLVFHHSTDKILFSNNNVSPDNPIQVNLHTEIVSIRPRKVGTFVTSQTKYYYRDYCIATSEMTALVYGLSPNKVISWQRTPTKNNSCNNNVPKISVTEKKKKKKTVYKVTIPSHATMLYRLSGDYNPIHVEGTSSDNQDAILHGLCTLGYATRIILRHVKTMSDKSNDVRLTAIRCNFVKTVYVGDILHIEVWGPIICTKIDGNTSINFRVSRVASKETVVDEGVAEFQGKISSKL